MNAFLSWKFSLLLLGYVQKLNWPIMINAHANEMLWPKKNENKKAKVDEKKLFLKKLFC